MSEADQIATKALVPPLDSPEIPPVNPFSLFELNLSSCPVMVIFWSCPVIDFQLVFPQMIRLMIWVCGVIPAYIDFP